MSEKMTKRRMLWLTLLISLILASSLALAAKDDDDEDEEDEAKGPVQMLSIEEEQERLNQVNAAEPVDKGADTCLKCHDEDNEYPVFPIFQTAHAVAADARTPFADKQCEACHGNGGDHKKKPKRDQPKAPIINFGKDAWTPAKEQNERCLACHSNHQRINWKGSSHEFNEVPCASCHIIHAAKDPVLERKTQPEVCYQCHMNERAKFFQISHHPVREGQMSCSECHDVHGENGSGLTVAAVVREKCTSCHAEKRGPFLWEHEPSKEDCTLCHDTHGSNHPALLKKRPPQLCQECHAQAGHPSVSYDGSQIPTVFLGVKGCLNCHSRMHGTNHPSGVSPLR